MTVTTVAILDLGLGNLHSVAMAFERAGAKATLTSDADVVHSCDRLVFPGQGAFRECAEALADGVGEAIVQRIEEGKPYMGICLGMQALLDGSDEAPGAAGLGVFKGRVVRFSEDLRDREGGVLKVPHIGWNQIRTRHPLLENDGWYYFVHSYFCQPEDASLTVATADYGGPFCAALGRDNVFACQFHPEKSHRAGARLIARFMEADRWN